MDKLSPQDKTQLDIAIKNALEQGVVSGKWNKSKFCLVVKPELQEAAFEYIKTSLEKIRNDSKNPNKENAKVLLKQITKSPEKQASDKETYSANSLYENSVFEFITESKPYDPKTKIEFRFQFNESELEAGVEDALKKIKGKSNIKFFPQLADVTDKDSKDNLDLSKPQDLQILFNKTKDNTSSKYSAQEQALIYNFDLALRRSLKIAELLGDTDKKSKIKSILGEKPEQTWSNAKSQRILESANLTNGVLEVGGLVILAPYIKDSSQTRDSASANEFTITRENRDFNFPSSVGVSYAGVRDENGNIATPQGLYKEHRDASIQEVKEIKDAVEKLKPKSEKQNLFDKGFRNWVDDKEKQEKEAEPITKNKLGTKAKQKQKSKNTDEQKKPEIETSEVETYRSQADALGISYTGLDMVNPNFQREVGIQNDEKLGLFENAMLNMYKFLATPARALVYLGREATYGISKIDESVNIDKETKENISKKFDDFIKGIDKNNPNLNHFELSRIRIATRGGYSEEKFNKIVREKTENFKTDLLEIFTQKINEADFSSEQKKALISEFSKKLDNVLVSAKPNVPNKDEDARNTGSIEFVTSKNGKLANDILKEELSGILQNKFGKLQSRLNGRGLSDNLENKKELITNYINQLEPDLLNNFEIKTEGDNLKIEPKDKASIQDLNKLINFIENNIFSQSNRGKFSENFIDTKKAYTDFMRLVDAYKQYNGDNKIENWEQTNLTNIEGQLKKGGIGDLNYEDEYSFEYNGKIFKPTITPQNTSTANRTIDRP
ncbi:MAG: hypothetical protein SFT90_05510 [Rickettsiales bacterium]|nr:hypothetical protein [Rickettsiales bacterium]